MRKLNLFLLRIKNKQPVKPNIQSLYFQVDKGKI